MSITIGELFAGYGGLGIATAAAFDARTAWVSDIDPGACKVLAHRFPDAPNLGDITRIDWADVEPVDIITGGSPCQDLSTAGRRAGMTDGTRSNLWVQMREAIATLRPSFVVWENVRGAYSAEAASDVEPCPGCMGDGAGKPALRALGRVLGDLATLGYDNQWRGLRAADVGACHQRFRVFVLARRRDAADAHRPRLEGRRRAGGASPAGFAGHAEQGTGGPLELLPTPRTSDTNGAGQHGSGGADLRTAVELLPTPSASVANDGEGPETWLARRERVKLTADNGNGMGMPLSIAVQLLPTPRATDGTKGGPNQRGSSGDLMPPSAVMQFGKYAPAVTRQERVLGHPAPAPTEPTGKGGAHRLSARFGEWMMGLRAGWITDVPGVTRNEALRMEGNGVFPAQAYAAITHMLATTERGMTGHACQCINPHMRPVPHPGHCCLRDVPDDFDRHTMRLLCHDGEWREAYPQPDDRAPLPGQETLL